MENYQDELQAAKTLARQAGALLRRYYAGTFAISEKVCADSYSEPVTEADHASNTLIVNGLQQAFPDDGILAEESADNAQRLNKRRVWMVDPIDGTSGFIAHDDDFAVQIGLAVEGVATLGVVYQPVPDVLFWAVQGAGTWTERSGQPPQRAQVAAEQDVTRMTLAVSRSHRSPRMGEVVRQYGFAREVSRGSVGIKMGLIAEQQAHLYIHLSPRTKQWDTCAPEIILREAGGAVTDLFGGPLSYNTREVQNLNGIMASNAVAHGDLVQQMKPLLERFGRTRRVIK